MRALLQPLLEPHMSAELVSIVIAAAHLLVYLAVIFIYAPIAIYVERKVASFIQCRLGPMEVGPQFALKIGSKKILPEGWYGLGTLIGDGVKLLAKEDIIPAKADGVLFRLAPYVAMGSTLLAFSVLPLSPVFIAAPLDGAMLILLAASSVGVLGLVMAGYASNNKWSLYGAIRSVAQVVSYEVPMGLALATVVMHTGSMDFREIAVAQDGSAWGILGWNIFRSPWLLIAGVAYAIAALAETNRTPFDIPEAESELVSGYHTEYSGIRFGLFFFAEYSNMLLVSMVGSLAFLGGFSTGLPGMTTDLWFAPFVLLAKSFACVGLMIWLRWTLPRFRVDRLMTFCWKAILPLAVVAFLGAGIAVIQDAMPYQAFWRFVTLLLLYAYYRAVRAGLKPMPRRAGGGAA